MKTKIITLSLLIPMIAFVFIANAQGIIMEKTAKMTIENGTQIKVVNGGNLLLKADDSGTASLIDRNTSNQITYSGGGESKVELFLSEDNWHYVSSPVTDAQSSVFMDIYLKQFNEADSVWYYIFATDSVLHPMQGYASWAASSLTGDAMVTYNGELNCGAVSTSLTNHGGATHNSKGFNFVGNPYPSAINWQLDNTAWTRTNIDPTVYLYNPTAGQYGNYNRLTKIGNNGVDSIIAPKQGFFVHVTTNGTGTLGINNNARLHNDKVFMKSSGTIYDNLLYIQVSGTAYNDETQIFFEESTTSDFDYQFDAMKLFGKTEAPQLFTGFLDETIYSVNGLPEVSEELHIPLGFIAGEDEDYTLKISWGDMFAGEVEIYLEDKQTSYIQNIKENSSYSFASSLLDETDRFVIHFSNPLSVEEQEFDKLFDISVTDNVITLNNSGSENAYAKIIDLTGRSLTQKELLTGQNLFIVNGSTAWYLVYIQVGAQNYIKKIFVR
jgi:hypothetical protein